MTAGSIPSERQALARWIALCAIGELLGIAAGALWYGGAFLLIGEPPDLPGRLLAWTAMTLSAVPEALILGALQTAGLKPFWPVRLRSWLAATLAVGLLGWGVGSAIPLFLFPGDAGPAAEPGAQTTSLMAALFGAAAGLLFGAVQSLALPKGARLAWTLANAVGWAAGLPLIFLGAGLGADQPSLALRIARWAVGGLGAGAAVGLATSTAIALRPR